MRVVLISVAALLISMALFISGNVMLGTLISLRLDLEGVNDTLMGVILAFYSIGFVLGAMLCARVIKEVGHIRAFAVFAAIACASSIMHPLWVNVTAWAVMRFLVGFSVAGLSMVTESWINDRATNETRGTILGFYTIIVYLASTAGQVLVGVGSPLNYKVYSIVAVLFVLALIPLALTRSMIPAAPSNARILSTRVLVTKAPAGMTGVLVAGIGLGGFVSLGPVFAIRSGLDVGELSIYMGFSVACAIALQWPAGWLSDRWGRMQVLISLLILGAFSAVATAFLSEVSIVYMFAFSGIYYALCACMYPVGLALANDQLPNDQLVPASAALLRVYGVGTVIGPLVGGYLMGQFNPGALFIFIACIMVLAGAVIHVIFRKYDEVPVTEQGDYAVMPPTSSPIIVELDPRNEEYDDHSPGEPAEWDLADKLEMLVIDADSLTEDYEEDAEPVAEEINPDGFTHESVEELQDYVPSEEYDDEEETEVVVVNLDDEEE